MKHTFMPAIILLIMGNTLAVADSAWFTVEDAKATAAKGVVITPLGPPLEITVRTLEPTVYKLSNNHGYMPSNKKVVMTPRSQQKNRVKVKVASAQ